MAISQPILHEISEQLCRAEESRQPLDRLTGTYSDFSVADAYSVQNTNAAKRLRQGRRLIGYKIGLTSLAAQKHFNVHEPDFGHLFDSMCIADEGEVSAATLIQPKIEGEIAFVLGRELRGPGVTAVDVLGSIDYALVALEIIDSRIKNWDIRAADTIADNGSSALLVVSSTKKKIDSFGLETVGMALSMDSEVLVTGAGAAVMGNPIHSVVFLANKLGEFGRTLLPGEVILTGSLGGMLPFRGGHTYQCEMSHLGKVGVRCR